MNDVDVFLTPSAATRLLAKLDVPRSEGWLRHAAATGKLPCLRTSTGRRLFRESDIRAFVANAGANESEPRPAA